MTGESRQLLEARHRTTFPPKFEDDKESKPTSVHVLRRTTDGARGEQETETEHGSCEYCHMQSRAYLDVLPIEISVSKEALSKPCISMYLRKMDHGWKLYTMVLYTSIMVIVRQNCLSEQY
jgi:hypothetical protein